MTVWHACHCSLYVSPWLRLVADRRQAELYQWYSLSLLSLSLPPLSFLLRKMRKGSISDFLSCLISTLTAIMSLWLCIFSSVIRDSVEKWCSAFLPGWGPFLSSPSLVPSALFILIMARCNLHSWRHFSLSLTYILSNVLILWHGSSSMSSSPLPHGLLLSSNMS